MDEFSRELNQLLVCTYRDVGKLEEGMLHSVSGMEVSIGELHLMEAIGEAKDRGLLICELAQHEPVNDAAIRYINRLSDHLFVLARHLNDDGATDEPTNPDDPTLANGYDGGGWGGPPPDAAASGSSSGTGTMPHAGAPTPTAAQGGTAARGAASTSQVAEVAEVAAL